MAREATRSPWHTSRTRSFTRSAAKPTVNTQVQQSEVTGARLHLEPDANGPDIFDLQRRLRADELSLVPRSLWTAVAVASISSSHLLVEGRTSSTLIGRPLR